MGGPSRSRARGAFVPPADASVNAGRARGGEKEGGPMSVFVHARDPLLSVWQSAVDAVASKKPGPGAAAALEAAPKRAGHTGRASETDPLIAGTNALVAAMSKRLEKL